MTPLDMHRWAMLVGVCLVGWTALGANAEENRSPTVGAEGRIEQLPLPGSELEAKPLADDAPIVVRVLEVFPRGDAMEYDLQFFGMEPGSYDLKDWLVRADGSSTDDLPPIPVEIRSLLPPGQVQPNPLETGWLPRMGGYKRLFQAAAVLWLLGMGLLLFAGRRKDREGDDEAPPATLAELLRPRLEAAREDRLPAEQYAELERMLFGYFRRRLRLEDVPVDKALARIHADPQVGPLMKQLEEWMHHPAPDRSVDLAKLLAPLRDLPAEEEGVA